jgi:hypothetical protein
MGPGRSPGRRESYSFLTPDISTTLRQRAVSGGEHGAEFSGVAGDRNGAEIGDALT